MCHPHALDMELIFPSLKAALVPRMKRWTDSKRHLKITGVGSGFGGHLGKLMLHMMEKKSKLLLPVPLERLSNISSPTLEILQDALPGSPALPPHLYPMHLAESPGPLKLLTSPPTPDLFCLVLYSPLSRKSSFKDWGK